MKTNLLTAATLLGVSSTALLGAGETVLCALSPKSAPPQLAAGT